MAFKASITESELQELLRPKLRVFFSIDVVGSTSFKHESEYTNNQGWLAFFAAFFTEFPDKLNQLRVSIAETRDWKELPQFHLWKTLGDELVFYVELSHPQQAGCCLTVFRSAINDAHDRWSTGENRLPVAFKGTAWLAGFPVGNAAMALEGTRTEPQYDFIGPQIDLGFRLTKFSSRRRLVVSVELAALILNGAQELKFFFEAGEPLKGVLKDRRYPLIWIDCLETNDGRNTPKTIHELEDELLGREPVVMTKPTLKTFCIAYIQEIGSPLHVPFVVGHEKAPFSRPDGYAGDLARADDRLRTVFHVLIDESRPAPHDERPLSELEGWTPPKRPASKKSMRKPTRKSAPSRRNGN